MDDLINFLDHSSCPISVFRNIKTILEQNGYENKDISSISQNEKSRFFIEQKDSIAVFNFCDNSNARFITCQSNFPCFVSKNLSIRSKSGCKIVDVSPIDEGIWISWLDRDLKASGIVKLQTNGTEYEFFESTEPVAIMASIASHLSKGSGLKPTFKLNQIVPIIDIDQPSSVPMINKISGIDQEVQSSKVYFTSFQGASLVGTSQEFLASQAICGPGISYVALKEFIAQQQPSSGFSCLFITYNPKHDSEGHFPINELERIIQALKIPYSQLKNSTLVSIRGFPGKHPNMNSISNIPLGGGIMHSQFQDISFSFDKILLSKVSNLINKELSPGPDTEDNTNISCFLETIGSKFGMKFVDLGIPILGLGSIRELAHINDIKALESLIRQVLI